YHPGAAHPAGDLGDDPAGPQAVLGPVLGQTVRVALASGDRSETSEADPRLGRVAEPDGAGRGQGGACLRPPLQPGAAGGAGVGRRVMQEAARRQGVAPARISFIDAWRWLKHARPGAALPRLVVNPQRPGRVEPRVRKRRPKQYDLMRRPRAELRQALLAPKDT